MNYHERRRLAISLVVPVAVQGFDVEGLMLASQFQDELMAGEGLCHSDEKDIDDVERRSISEYDAPKEEKEYLRAARTESRKF